MSGIAIVLNKLDKGSGFLLLHQSLGKIRCFLSYKKRANLCIGSLISCDLTQKKSYYIFNQVDTDFVPLPSENHDIYFIHNLLKICIEIPFEVRVDDIFSHMLTIYKEMHLFVDEDKNRSLLKLFFLLSLFPENIQLYNMVIGRSIAYDNHVAQKGLQLCWEKYSQQKII